MIHQKAKPIGKNFELKQTYKNVRFEASTVCKKPLRSIQLVTKFWVDKQEDVDGNLKAKKLLRECRQALALEVGDWFYKEKIISVSDVPADTKSKTEKFFCLFEFTLFVKKQFSSDIELMYELHKATDTLYKNVFKPRQDLSTRKL
jgi:hypothetical protein